MISFAKLEIDSPVITEDMTLGIVSLTINEGDVIKSWYFQHKNDSKIINHELFNELQKSLEKAKYIQGNNGISTSLASFIPTDLINTSLIGTREISVDRVDQKTVSLTINSISTITRSPQPLLYHMLDSILDQAKYDSTILRFEISPRVLLQAKLQGYFQYLSKYIMARELTQKYTDGLVTGFIFEDTISLKLVELRAKAKIINAEATMRKHKLSLVRNRYQDNNSFQISKDEIPYLSFSPKVKQY